MIRAATTHATLLTPPGAGAIAVVRVTGPEAQSIVESLMPPKSATALGDRPRQLRYVTLVADDTPVDDALVSTVPTGSEQTIDICCHGGIRIVERILEVLQARGAKTTGRPQRTDAVWPVRNRVEQEAVEALANARTESAVRFLADQYVRLPALLLDAASCCAQDAARADGLLEKATAEYQSARLLLDGITVAIVGPPNAGKSTLFNRLTGRTAAVVSEVHGTTRDWLCEWVELGGFPVRLLDTAGSRHAADALEADAIGRGQGIAETADLRLIMIDGSAALSSEERNVVARWLALGPAVLLANKVDVAPHEVGSLSIDVPRWRIAATTGTGVGAAVKAVLDCVGGTPSERLGPTLFTQRQREAYAQARARIETDPMSAAGLIRTDLLGAFA